MSPRGRLFTPHFVYIYLCISRLLLELGEFQEHPNGTPPFPVQLLVCSWNRPICGCFQGKKRRFVSSGDTEVLMWIILSGNTRSEGFARCPSRWHSLGVCRRPRRRVTVGTLSSRRLVWPLKPGPAASFPACFAESFPWSVRLRLNQIDFCG